MPIRIACPKCGKNLNVPDGLAGKRGKCPRCATTFEIPAKSLKTGDETRDDIDFPSTVAGQSAPVTASAGEVEPPSPPAKETDDPLSAPGVWYARIPSGEQLGPLESNTMRDWLVEGKLPAEAHVWREGWPDWRLVSAVFGQITTTITAAPSPPAMEEWLDVSGGDASAEIEQPVLAGSPELPQKPSQPVAPEVRRKTRGPSVIVLAACGGLILVIVLLVFLVVQQIARYRQSEAEFNRKAQEYQSEIGVPAPNEGAIEAAAESEK